MISKVSFATPVYNNSVGFKASKHPQIDKALKLAETKEVKDAIELTVKEKPDLKKVDDVTHDLNIERNRLTNNDKNALKQALKAQNEWQINVENGSREVLQYYIEQASKGESA